jgi:trigger factor
MRATTTLLENNRIMLTVEIDDAEMDEAMDSAARTLSKQVSVKGFRKGKVPKNVLIANIGGTSVLRSEAIRESLPDFYASRPRSKCDRRSQSRANANCASRFLHPS